MSTTDDRTPALNLPMPYADNMLEDDSERLRQALLVIDSVVASKASSSSVDAVTGALATKADLVAGKVPASQLPAYVDDVLEFANLAALPATGESGKIYVALDTGKTYRWGGSAYAEISASPGSTDAVPEGASNLYFTPARAEAAVPLASASVAGKVRVGNGLIMDGSGVLSSALGGGSAMSVVEVVPASNGLTQVGVPGGYVVGSILVAVNGAFLAPSDYTATDGNLVVFGGFTVGTADSVVVVKLSTVLISSLPPGSVGNTQLADGILASKVAFTQFGAGAVARTVQDKLRDVVSVKDFGAVGNGVANDAAAINAAIAAVVAAGGGTVFFPAGQYKCTSRIGTFVSAEDVTLWGYGAEIQNFAGTSTQGLMQFGNAALDANGMYSASTITVKNLNILGLKFTSSNVFNGAIPGRWSDQLPISVNTAKDVLIRDCYFENWDFAAIDFGAICKDVLVDACTFYSSQVDAGHANYGVRAFCYANYTNYSNGNGDLSPTDPNTGVLKAGYAYISDASTTWGHENISVTNCFFENVSHGVMVSAARRGIVANNRFKNMSTRSVSLTTYSRDYLCCNNVHSLDTAQQTSTGVSVFYGLGQATFRHQIQGEKFSVIGDTNNATGFGPIKCYINSHDWLIAGCRFDIPSWAGSGGRCINIEDNSDGEVRDNHFKCPNVVHPVTTLSAYSVTSPGYQQGKIWVIGNIFEAFSTGAMEIRETTSSPEPIVIKDNIVHGNPTRFVAANFSAAGKVAKLFLDGNKFLGSPVRYIDNIVTANKAILLNKDVLEIESFLSTGGGVANPSTTAVSFNFSAYSLPACFTNGQKRYLFTAYGERQNGQASTDFFFRITGETSTSISGEIVRNAGASFQIGNVGLKVIFEPFNT